MPKNPRVAVDITATDDATPTIQKLEKRIDGLEADEARVVVTAATETAQRKLDNLTRDVDQLDGDEATVRARAIDQATDDLRNTERLLDDLDGETGTVRIDADTSGVDAGLAGIKGEIGDIGGLLDGGLGLDTVTGLLSGPGGVVAGVGAVGAAAVDLVGDFAGVVGEVEQISAITGQSIEDASRLRAVWVDAGFDVSDLLDIVLQLNGALADSPELAEELGINLDDGRGPADRFVQVVEALNTEIGDVGRRGVLASQLFGEEGVKQVTAVTTQVGDLQTAIDDVDGSRIFDGDDVDDARRFRDYTREMAAAWESAKLDAARLAITIGEAPGKLDDWLTDLPGLGGWADDQRKTLDDLGGVGAGAAEQIEDAVRAAGEQIADMGDEATETSEIQRRASTAAETFIGQVNDKYREQRDAADAAAQAAIDGAIEARDEYNSFLGVLDRREAFLRLQGEFDDVRSKAVAAWDAAETGADDAESKARDYELAVIDAKQAVYDYGVEVLGLPDDVVTDVVADIDWSSVDSANRALDELDARSVRVPVTLDPQWTNVSSLPWYIRDNLGISGARSAGGAPRSAPAGRAAGPTVPVPAGYRAAEPSIDVAVPITTRSTGGRAPGAGTVNVYLPRTADAVDVVAAVERWTRINGRML